MANKVRSIFANENYVDLTLYQFGYEKCDPLHANGPAVWNHFLFHYIQSGKGQLRSKDEKGNVNTYHLQAGQGFLFWPKQQNYYIADEEDPWVYTWVEFDGLHARELMLHSGLTFNYPVYMGRDDEEREKMSRELLWLTEHPQSPPLELIGHLYLFLSGLIHSSSARKEATGGRMRDFYVRESLNYIEQHYAEDISVEDIAAYCSINRSYLGKIFRSVLNASPQEFLLKYRMKKACELLEITTMPIGEISAMVGYPNQLNFSRTFKNQIGVPPREWRNSRRR
ncbi:AraC family transcriptional regulator [Ruminococcaceae bacterium OttesenSCG-928-L11]|nr:AraC family transcriptional regulator [Ruminococcaceae bacterium OttesenSCG-928-L11]